MVTQVSILRVSLQSGVHTHYRSFTFAQVQNESRCGNYTVLGNPRRVPQHGPWGGWPVDLAGTALCRGPERPRLTGLRCLNGLSMVVDMF